MLAFLEKRCSLGDFADREDAHKQVLAIEPVNSPPHAVITLWVA